MPLALSGNRQMELKSPPLCRRLRKAKVLLCRSSFDDFDLAVVDGLRFLPAVAVKGRIIDGDFFFVTRGDVHVALGTVRHFPALL